MRTAIDTKGGGGKSPPSAAVYRQHPPFCVQVEAVEGCNLRCPFCGINGIRDNRRTYQYMNLDTAQRLAQQLSAAKWNSRVEFAMHGEPTKHPQLAALVASFRCQLPKAYLMMETNGSGLLDGVASILKLFNAGLNTIALDEYQNVPWANRVRKWKQELSDHVEVYEYPEAKGGNPHSRSGSRRLMFVAPIDTATKGTHSQVNNHCGSGAPLDISCATARCAKPFREISVRWDGNIALCCNDWRGIFKVGNILHRSVYELWHNEVMQAARRKLLYGQRDFPPCAGCNARSYRVGLLPDPMGKAMLEPADKECDTQLRKAVSGSSYTVAVVRPWEIQSAK